jgi:predicted nuclease of restriction endonuclease-like RecB superfamily
MEEREWTHHATRSIDHSNYSVSLQSSELHVLENFQKARHIGETRKNDFRTIVGSTNIPMWKENIGKVKVDSEEAYEWLQQLVLNKWINRSLIIFP